MFYLFLYYNNFSVSLCRMSLFFVRLLRHLRLFVLFLHSFLCALLFIFVWLFLLTPFLFRFWGNRFLSLLYPYYILIIPYFCPVPNFSLFLLSHGLFLFGLSLYFLYTLCLFLPKTSFKKDSTLCFHYPHPCRAQLFLLILFLGLVPVFSRSSVGGTLSPF